MKTIEEKAEEYAKNKIKCYNDYFLQPQFSNAKTDFAAGYNAALEWISVDDELPEIKNDGYWFIGKDKDDIHYALYIDSIVEHKEITATEITHWLPINND